MIEMLIVCPCCKSEDVTMASEPVIEHKPTEHNWYGQAHMITVDMFCESCKQEFDVVLGTYKLRASVRVNARETT